MLPPRSTDGCIAHEVRARPTAKTGSTIDHRDISLREAHRNWMFLAFGLRGHGRAAEDVLMENRLIRMSPEGFADFMSVLFGPATPVPEMVELANRPAPWESGYVAKTRSVALSAPEPLTANHGVSEFTCGKPTLDHWLKARALSNQEKVSQPSGANRRMNLASSIEGLVAGGQIPEAFGALAHLVRRVGNVSAHASGETVEFEQASQMYSLTRELLNTLYFVPERVSSLRTAMERGRATELPEEPIS